MAAALVHGRYGRTTDLTRADIDKAKDFVGRLGFHAGTLQLGLSAYLAEFSTKRTAFGLDWLFTTPRLSASGELVVQRNRDFQMDMADPAAISLSSLGIYAQFNYLLTNRLSLYGLYETWRLYANDEIMDRPTYKIFHGLKFQLNQHTRWTILEFGRMIHNNFDKGKVHISTQLEFFY